MALPVLPRYKLKIKKVQNNCTNGHDSTNFSHRVNLLDNSVQDTIGTMLAENIRPTKRREEEKRQKQSRGRKAES